MKRDIFRYLTVILRPAVVFAIRRGLKFQDMTEALKEVCVSVAAAELESSHEKSSKSRIAVMTGLQRRDITRLLESDGADPRPEHILMKVLGQWSTDAQFRSGSHPRPLTYEGTQSEFSNLVRSVSKDLNPYALLFELERIGAVKKDEQRLSLVNPTYEVRDNDERGWSLWSADAEDLMFSVEENVTAQSGGVPNLHISTRYDNIVVGAMPTIRKWLLEKGALFHSEVRAFLSQYDKDLNPVLYEKKGGGKVTLGSFSRTVEPEQALSEKSNVAS